MTETSKKAVWGARIGWLVLVLVFVAFIWGMNRRARLEATGANVIRMLFVPSVEQGTLVERGDELARFIRRDSGLILRSEVPTSYAAVIQALGSGQADVAWMPAFAYVIAHARYGAEAKLQVVRSLERFAVVVSRAAEGEPSRLSDLAGRKIAFPRSLHPDLADGLRARLAAEAPGWIEVPVESDTEAVERLVSSAVLVDAAVSSFVHSGPFDFVGDGRKELEYERPGTLEQTQIIFTTEEPVSENVKVYHGCVFARVDSGVRQLRDLTGQSFAFSDETSTSGHIFPRLLLERDGVSLGRVYYAGGHPNVVQAVWDGKALGGSAFYSPPSPQQRAEGLFVGDARYLLMKRMAEAERRDAFLEEVRVLRKTDPIPNDLCAVRRGFPEQVWQRFAESLARYLETEEGKETLFDLLAGVAADPTDDAAFDGFREALATSGMSADSLLAAEEEKLEQRKQRTGGDS
jgi:ABC-type phosphate/phosphonate transport system substrate-binding protein